MLLFLARLTGLRCAGGFRDTTRDILHTDRPETGKSLRLIPDCRVDLKNADYDHAEDI